jgi:beta-N-acetylhexosaminidase
MGFSGAAPVFLPLLLLTACLPASVDKRAAASGGAATKPADAVAALAEREQAVRFAAALDDRLLAAQVIVSGVDGRGSLGRDMQTLLRECPSGGIVLFRYNLDTENAAIRSLIAESAALIAAGTSAIIPAGIPPFVAVDHEGGPVNRFRPGVAALPAAGSYFERTREEGRGQVLAGVEADSFRAGSELAGLGINLNLAPVAEYLNDDNREFLNDRSYGPDPAFTVEAAAAFMRGMGQAGLLCGVKHFPGSAGQDPHRFPSILGGDRTALDELAAPFATLIRGGQARVIMAAHSAVPALDSEHIASLSPAVMGGWLRGELGFEGIIISDDFSMAAANGDAASPSPAAVRSLAAGADMVLVWPPDLRRTHGAIMAALAGGSLSRNRLREAAARIILEKLRMGLIEPGRE